MLNGRCVSIDDRGRMEDGGEDLYRLLVGVPVGVPVGFAVALSCRKLIEGLEGFCDFSDAAYEQDCFFFISISKCIVLGGAVLARRSASDLLPGKTIQMKFMKK